MLFLLPHGLGTRLPLLPHLTYAPSPTHINPTHTSDGNLYIADSESSSVRAVAMATGSAKAVVGGAIDPLVSVVKLKERRRGREYPQLTWLLSVCVCCRICLRLVMWMERGGKLASSTPWVWRGMSTTR